MSIRCGIHNRLKLNKKGLVMSLVFNSHLEARVCLVNYVNELANRLEPTLKELFLPYVGKKVTISGGSLLKKLREQVNDTVKPYLSERDQVFHDYRYSYNVQFTIKSRTGYLHYGNCESWEYWETGIYIGSLRDSVLVEIDDRKTERKTDYLVDKIRTIRESAEKLRERVRELELQIVNFDRCY